jgi:hypothetical protein
MHLQPFWREDKVYFIWRGHKTSFDCSGEWRILTIISKMDFCTRMVSYVYWLENVETRCQENPMLLEFWRRSILSTSACANNATHQHTFKKGERPQPSYFSLVFKFQCNLIVINLCKAGVKPSWTLYRTSVKSPLIGCWLYRSWAFPRIYSCTCLFNVISLNR